VKNYLSNLLEVWNRFSKSQKIAASVGFFSVLILIVVFAAVYSEEQYTPLFDYIRDKREALAVQSKLKELGFQTKSSEAGHVILVKENRKEQAHLALAEANALPEAVDGYKEIMDGGNSFGITDKELDLRINRSKEGSLAKTIMLFRNISHANVHVERATESLFSEDQKETRVSVLLTPVDPLTKISPDQVKTILNLVTHSVLGVKKENVFISDDKGRDLIDLLHEKDKKLSQREMTRKTERDLKKKAFQALAEIYGQENVTVEVNCMLDFDKVDEESKELLPPVAGEEQGVKISEETKETKSETRDPKEVPGTQTNIPGYQSPEMVRTLSETKEARVNYAYKQRTRNVIRATGLLRRVTVSVVINQDVLPEQTLSGDIRQRIVEMVSTAVGLDTESRSDKISVTSFAFNKLRLEYRKSRALEQREFEAKILSVSLISMVLGFMLLMYQQFRRKAIERRQELLRATRESLEEQAQVEEEVLTAEQKERNERERIVIEMVRENPDEMVKIIRTMMFDENYY
jgi:flagellar M-ring protein FliF